MARVARIFLAVLATIPSAWATDIVLTPPAGGGVAVTNSAGNANRFRVADDGSVTLPGVAAVPGSFTGLCAEIATGKVGTCALSAGTVTSVGAVSPLGSSGGSAPSISITGVVDPVNGGTGRNTLTTNSVLYGEGTGQMGLTNVGGAGTVLAGSAGAPLFTSSPSISGNLTLTGGLIDLPSTTSASQGFISKGGVRFIHNFGVTNMFAGSEAGNFSVAGTSNTGMGYRALMVLTSGSYNTAVGYRTLATATTTTENTAVGYQALAANTTGNGNTAVGSLALSQNTTGAFNIALGEGAGFNHSTGFNNIAIGNLGVAAESNTMRIGAAGAQSRAFIAGINGVTTSLAAIPVLVDANGQLGTISSSRRVKDRIVDMDAASEALMRLRPVTFHYTSHGPDGPLQYGLVAEEVAEVYPDLVMNGADGKIQTVMYQYLPPMLLNEVQKQQRRIAGQERTIAQQGEEIAELKHLVGQLIAERRKP